MRALQYRTVWLGLGWLLVVGIWYFSLTPSPPQIDLGIAFFDKISHFTAYAVLMGWFMQLYRRGRVRLFYAISFIGMGIAIEFLQGMGTARLFEPADMLANALGVLGALLLIGKRFDRLLHGFEKLLGAQQDGAEH